MDVSFEHVAYLCYAEGTVLAMGSRNQGGKACYQYYGFDGEAGELIWERSVTTDRGTGGSHGEQDQHPVIVKDRIYAYTPVCDIHIRTGEIGEFEI